MEDTPLRDKEFYLTSGRQYTDKAYKNYYNMYHQIRYDFHYKLCIFFSKQIGHFNRRTEFRKYLDRTGVLDKLTEIFMDLYENPVINFPVVE